MGARAAELAAIYSLYNQAPDCLVNASFAPAILVAAEGKRLALINSRFATRQAKDHKGGTNKCRALTLCWPRHSVSVLCASASRTAAAAHAVAARAAPRATTAARAPVWAHLLVPGGR